MVCTRKLHRDGAGVLVYVLGPLKAMIVACSSKSRVENTFTYLLRRTDLDAEDAGASCPCLPIARIRHAKKISMDSVGLPTAQSWEMLPADQTLHFLALELLDCQNRVIRTGALDIHSKVSEARGDPR